MWTLKVLSIGNLPSVLTKLMSLLSFFCMARTHKYTHKLKRIHTCIFATREREVLRPSLSNIYLRSTSYPRGQQSCWLIWPDSHSVPSPAPDSKYGKNRHPRKKKNTMPQLAPAADNASPSRPDSRRCSGRTTSPRPCSALPDRTVPVFPGKPKRPNIMKK